MNSKTIVVFLTTCVLSHAGKPLQAICILGQSSKVKGTLILTQLGYGVRIRGKITGLPKGIHGFHVHEYGDESDGCTSYGGHWNPFDRNHGGPRSPVRHAGDLGNIISNSKEVAWVNIFDRQVSLRPNRFSVFGRGIVVHAVGDDLGMGGDAESLVTGNAGSRLACCIIAHRAT
ncbi:superoxide dismutase [Cu-Zn]-like [Clytia hemisphaerica]|uniref:Superoxide dismutase [Cu-Zn] n=1 Tax=Clytia hemisphaerica TaxID=252671 RepID=A0A7M5X6X4_9CNID